MTQQQAGEIVRLPSVKEEQPERDIHAAIDEALKEHPWRDEDELAGLREQSYIRSYRELWGVMRPINHSFATGGWAYWLMWALLIPSYFGLFGAHW